MLLWTLSPVVVAVLVRAGGRRAGYYFQTTANNNAHYTQHCSLATAHCQGRVSLPMFIIALCLQDFDIISLDEK